MGELAALEQIRSDSRAARQECDPGRAVRAARRGRRRRGDGKTRGAITNLFGSQGRFQAETMALALSAGDLIAGVEFPDRAAFATAGRLDRRPLRGQSARGPRTGRSRLSTTAPLGALAECGALRALERAHQRARAWPSTRSGSPARERCSARAIAHFGLELREDATLADLACAVAS